ncbi:hypothetical protein ANCCAN_21812 [Ancylostoma caninum]|uniref:Pre-SET domain-containing protein n=1 Tax=Ancylostoma caninum TaxID=29170 RepID=A0A368FJZ8_ANCCA|nr:hypothetical protein ANCCAN_21812 [Ancylostoma caninum]
MFYCARQFPYNHQVDVKTISRDFCSGCSCTDDCSDPLKCECQPLTVSNVQRLVKASGRQLGSTGIATVRSLEKLSLEYSNAMTSVAASKNVAITALYSNRSDIPYSQSGWGVRAPCDLPAAAFVVNHVGALRTDSLADALQGEDQYFANLDLNDAIMVEK